MTKRMDIALFKRYTVFALVCVMLLYFTPIKCETSDSSFLPSSNMQQLNEDGSIVDPILEDGAVYTETTVEFLGDKIVSVVTDIFNPSFNTILDLESGEGINGTETDHHVGRVANSITISSIYNFAKYFGIILANLILFLNLFFCLMGKAEQIRDTPLALVGKYILSLVLIHLSFNITIEIINFCSGMWTDIVLSQTTGEAINFSTHFYQSFTERNDNGQITSILGVYVVNEINFINNFILPLLVIFLLWKLFKQFLRLFLEIAERYFVMVLLLCFMPAVIPTMISNNTKNILGSYMRMFFSQLFIMLTNSIFLKIFIAILLRGGWTAGVMNYILSLAFLRVCQRIDTYMLTMGLNVAQTGGGVIGAGIGAGKAIGNLIRDFALLDRARTNIGKGMVTAALATNNEKLFDIGNKMSKSITQLAGEGIVGGLGPNAQSFVQSRAHSNPSDMERNTAMFTNNTIDGYNSVASQFGVPESATQSLVQQGVNLEDVASIKQLDDSGSAFGFYDSQGNGIGFTSDGVTEAYDGRTEDLEAISADEAIAADGSPQETLDKFDVMHGSTLHHNAPLLDNQRILTTTGTDELSADKYGVTHAFRDSYGTDKTTCIRKSLDASGNLVSNGYDVEIKSVAAHPDILKNSRYEKVKGNDGKLYGVRMSKSEPRNTNTYAKNPASNGKKK